MILVHIMCSLIFGFFVVRSCPEYVHHLARDFHEALYIATEGPASHLADTVWVMGGQEVYKVSADTIAILILVQDYYVSDCDCYIHAIDIGDHSENITEM